MNLIYIVIGIIIIVLVLILLSFLLIPLNLSLYLKIKESKILGRFTVKFLGIRIFSKEIPEEKKDEDKEEEEKEGEKEKEKDDKKDKFDLDRILKILRLFKESLPYLYRLITAFLGSFTLKKLSVDITMGMESPADTALFTGYIWSFTYPFNTITPFNITITPDFQRRILEGDFAVEVNFKLIKIVTEAIRAYTKKPVRELINEIRR